MSAPRPARAIWLHSVVMLLLVLLSVPRDAAAQACTGLCLQQVACTAGATTSISGTVYAPNGVDPLPNVLVFVPNATPAPMTAGVQCLAPGATPSGSPLVGTITATDGTFTITNVPVGANIPLVIQSGKWRRQVVIPSTAACTNTPVTAGLTRFPRNQSEGDIPQFAIATGRVDSLECVLRKVGIDDAEFTNPISTGRIHLFEGQGTTGSGNNATSTGGAVISTSTPSQSTLMADPTLLAKYDVVMLPCQGTANGQATDATQNANFLQYVNQGGRVFANHWSYIWLANNASLSPAASFSGSTGTGGTVTATVNTSFAGGATLAAWLQIVGASSTPGQVSLNNVFATVTSVGAATQPVLSINAPNPTVQFTFNMPIGAANQCGRVLFNDYHVEVPLTQNGAQVAGITFPSECAGTTTNLTPQDKLLEYSLFDLTSNGSAPTLSPSSIDFGNEAAGFQTASKTFTWTNNSIFAASVTSATVTGDFLVTSQNCQNVAAGSSCQIAVAFKPTVVGLATGTLTVAAPAGNLSATVTGNGVPALSASAATITFLNTDVGAHASSTVTLTNNAPGAVSLNGIAISGDYSVTSCAATLAAGASCTMTITFTPKATGTRAGAITGPGLSVALTGAGVDFSVAFNSTSGSVLAGNSLTQSLAVLPIAGFSAQVTMTCTTNAPASVCTPTVASFVPSTSASAGVTITTTSKFTVVGYSGFGVRILGWLAACVTAFCFRRNYRVARLALLLLVLGGTCAAVSGCSGKLPGQNASYTPAGGYTYTVTTTDGFLVHTATYALTVTSTR